MDINEKNKVMSCLICADLLSICGRHIDNFTCKTTENNSLEITASFDEKPFYFFCENMLEATISADGKVLTIHDGFINGKQLKNITIRFFNYHQGNFIREPIC